MLPKNPTLTFHRFSFFSFLNYMNTYAIQTNALSIRAIIQIIVIKINLKRKGENLLLWPFGFYYTFSSCLANHTEKANPCFRWKYVALFGFRDMMYITWICFYGHKNTEEKCITLFYIRSYLTKYNRFDIVKSSWRLPKNIKIRNHYLPHIEQHTLSPTTNAFYIGLMRWW